MASSQVETGGTARAGFLLVHLLGVIAIVSLPSARLGQAVWRLPEERAIAGFAAGYVLCVAILAARSRLRRRVTATEALAALAAGYGATLLFLLLAAAPVARRLLVAELALGAGLVALTFLLRAAPALRVGAVGLLAIAGVAVQIVHAASPRPLPPQPRTLVTHLSSQLYDLEATSYEHRFSTSGARGGGLATFGDGYLVETGDGELYVASQEKQGGAFGFERYAYHVPLNTAAFVAAVGHEVKHSYFRAAGVLTQEIEGRLRLLVSHHFWNDAGRCFVMRVSALEGPRDDVLRGRPGLSWRTVYETSPCVPVELPGLPPFFGGMLAGGRLALINDSELLVSIGDHGLDGRNTALSVAQSPSSAYGKTILVNLADASSRVYSLGHRNPQGLVVAPGGVVWLTEHGPQGGDELNRIQRGANYGWPAVTYGVDYGTHAWPFDPIPGSHDGAGFTQPFYSWVPSIGVSNLLVSDSASFALWKGDLLVSALKDRSLHRLRIRDDRVVLVERIPVGERIRDLLQGRAGELLVWTDAGAFMVVRPGDDEQSGEALFGRCAGCHAAQDGHAHRLGPDLYKIVDRRVASMEGFQYSPALRAFGGTWTRARLDAFLESPEAVVPGTMMRFAGIKSASSRARIIAYLASGERRAPGDTIEPD